MKTIQDVSNWCNANQKPVTKESASEYSRRYYHQQVMIGFDWFQPKEKTEAEISHLVELIFGKLFFLGVPSNDLENYRSLIYCFINWLAGYEAYPILGDDEYTNQLRNIDSHKGFYLYGSTGVGKTTFLDAVSLACDQFNNEKNHSPLLIYNHGIACSRFCPIKVRANQITRSFAIGGYIGLYGSNGQCMDGGIDPFFAVRATGGKETCTSIASYDTGSICQVQPKNGCYPALYIDDFAWGQTAANTKNFGNSINVLEEVIKNRYDEDLLTFCTSNVKPTELTDATKDRMKAQFNVICFDRVESFRK